MPDRLQYFLGDELFGGQLVAHTANPQPRYIDVAVQVDPMARPELVAAASAAAAAGCLEVAQALRWLSVARCRG